MRAAIGIGTLLVGGALVVASCASPRRAHVERALAARARGDEAQAQTEFRILAEDGDDIAMIEIGLACYLGRGVPQNYECAMDWFIRAFRKGNGDAYNNIGVMYRDGLGVERNVKIAYALFWITHMRGLGSADTQYRAGGNLSKTYSLMSDADRAEALQFTEPYVEAYVTHRGTALSTYTNLLHAPGTFPLLEMARIGDKIVLP